MALDLHGVEGQLLPRPPVHGAQGFGDGLFRLGHIEFVDVTQACVVADAVGIDA